MAQTDTLAAVGELLGKADQFNTLTFWKATLKGMQKVADNTTESDKTDCIETFESFMELYNEMSAANGNRTAYDEGMKDKGQGKGSTMGFYIYQFQNNMDTFIDGVNVFNYCQLNYYLEATSKVFSSASGAANQAVNLIWRAYGGDDKAMYSALSTAVTNNDEQNAGKYFGQFLSLLLSVEIPESAEAGGSETGQIM